MRKKRHPEHPNHERWLVSYADFITLLFAFFVVMFATSRVDTRRLAKFSASFSEAVGMPLMPSPGAGLMPAPRDSKKEADAAGKDPGLPGEVEGLRTALALRAAKGEELAGLRVLLRGKELVLRLSDGVLFESGDDRVREPAARGLRAILDEIRVRDVDVRVEGHTDDVPIRTARFRSNWELSTARATAVVAIAAGDGRLAPERVSAAGYGEFRPIAPNTTPEGRALNRRVDLVIMSREPTGSK